MASSTTNPNPTATDVALESHSETRTSPLNQFLLRTFALRWETAVYIVIFLLAIFTRFYLLGDRVMSHDESLHTRYSYNLYHEGNFQHTPLMHGPILFHATAFAYFLFGDNDFTSRLYPALLGVILVMFPLLLRRWLGTWGALLASVMLLISPLLMYYNRYIRHDTPSIVAALVMAYCMLMYLNGPEEQRGRGKWLYILSAAMLWNLGSKETSFIYIAIFGAFLTLYWLVRMAQHLWNIPGRTAFAYTIIGILLGGVAALGMYIVLDIVPYETAIAAAQTSGWFGSAASRSFLVWTLLTIVAVTGATIGTMLVAYMGSRARINWQNVVALLAVGLLTALAFIVLEEISHVQPQADQTAVPVVPGEDSVPGSTETVSNLRWTPMIGVWVLGIVVVGGLIFARSRGWWDFLHQFPEFDILIVMGSLILPWLTAIVPYLMRGSAADFTAIGESVPQFIASALPVATPQEVGQVALGFLAFIPLAAIAIAAGLLWNWRRWLICAAIFHILFAFFFTTVFTNINGLATGMVYSLGYWLEQQGVRRGSQPQYYYLLLILPFYEFLPVIGSVLAMLTGLRIFWKRQRQEQEQALALAEAEGYPDDAFAEKPKPTAPAEDSARDDEGGDELPSLASVIGTPQSGAAVIGRKPAPSATRLEQVPFLLFVGWWGVLNLLLYSIAGEKMPWLGTHMTVPMILLAGWYFGRIFSKVDFGRFIERGWLYLLLVPLLLITLFQVVGPFLGGQAPAGLSRLELSQTGRWLAVVAISGVLIYIIYRVMLHTGWKHLWQMFSVGLFLLLAVITFRSAWMASMINYDYATEYLVYAHAAPAVKTVLADLEELSRRTTDGLDLVFGYDNEVSWPYSWYFRHFNNAIYFGSNPTLQRLSNAVAVVVGEANRAKVEPLLEDRYLHFEYIRLWWPMQDYFNLTAERISSALDFSPENPQAAQLRRGLFDIWWSRDYTTYGQAVNRDFNTTRWPVSDRMHFYVRKDIAAQIWPYGVGEGTVLNPLEDQPVNQCNANWQQLYALSVFDVPPLPLSRPLGLAVGGDRVYVAEEYNFRVSVFDKQGTYITSFGQQGAEPGANFNRPNSVAVAPDGTVYVADTWNYRISAFTPNGEFVTGWGQAGEYGFDAQTDPNNAFWGPRDVVIDAAGQVYVADTGNKRIRVYDASGSFLRDIGFGGSGLGQLDEPAGIAIDQPGRRLYVADTWNRRVSVFTLDGVAITSFPVRGWYEELGNRPYLAVDSARNLLYVTDPDGGRILVYNLEGECLGSFGQFNRELPDSSQFSTVGGIAVDDEGFVYISDAGNGRVLKFAPFTANVSVPNNPPVILEVESSEEATAEVLMPESTEELTPEATAAE